MATGGEPTPARGAGAKKNSQWGFMDIRGQYVIKPKFHFVSDFAGDLAVASVLDSKGWDIAGIIDRQGFFVVPPKYHSIFIGTKHAAVSTGYRIFDRVRWQLDRVQALKGQGSVEEDLRWLFADHKVIGMYKLKLIGLLGPPDGRGANFLHYCTGQSFCFNGIPGITFEFDDRGNITRWSRTSGDEIQHWSTINKYE